MEHIADILKAYPNVVIISDEVYEHMVFDNYKTLPRFANIPGMWDRTINLYSFGKTFSATATRVGWAIAPQNLIKAIHAVHQFNSFCVYGPLQTAIAETLDIANKPYDNFPSYYDYLRDTYQKSRNYALENFNKVEGYRFLTPEGTYFMIMDITDKEVKKHNFAYENETNEKYTKDFMFALQLAHFNQIVMTPLSQFYTPEHKKHGENYLRIAYCKKKETLDKAFDRLKKKV